MKTEHAAAEEWTAERLIKLITYEPDREDFEEASKAINDALADERERTRQEIMKVTRSCENCERLKRELSAAQAAIVAHNKHVEEMHTASSEDCYEIPMADTTALDAAIAVAVLDAKLREQQLVALLRESHQRLGNTAFPSLSARIAAQLAKVKEGK